MGINMNREPIIYLAFANDQEHPDQYLKELDTERLNLQDILTQSKDCIVQTQTEVTISRILNTFGRFEEQISIFHFSGHAGNDSLKFEGERGRNRDAFSLGLAKAIGKAGGVRLAFLNGCSTQGQVADFHQAHIPVVIATTHPVKDAIAREFAEHFYRYLVAGKTIRQAFEGAEDALLTGYRPEDLYRGFERQPRFDLRHPFQLGVDPSFPEAAEESLKDWNQKTDEPETESIAIGPLIYLLVDRTREERQFNQNLDAWGLQEGKKTPHYPQAFIIHGPGEEEPDSLTQRFRHYTLKDSFPLLGLSYKRVRKFVIDFPLARDFEEPDTTIPFNYLMETFRKEFRIPKKRKVTTTEIMLKMGERIDAALIQHNLQGEAWHPGMYEFIENYLNQIWNVQLPARQPHVVIFFNLSYEMAKGWKRWVGKGNAVSEQKLQELGKQVDTCQVLSRLQPVRKADVQLWQREYLEQEGELVDRLFKGKDKLPMREVHKGLKDTLEKYLQ